MQFLTCTQRKRTAPSRYVAGIGRAVVKALAQCGAEVIAFSRTQADLESLKEEVSIRIAVATL